MFPTHYDFSSRSDRQILADRRQAPTDSEIRLRVKRARKAA
jgi:hypothetical protein